MEGAELSHLVTGIIFQLCIILVAAKIAGEVSQRYLKIPTVLGELAAGIIIGPFALGGVEIGSLGPIFEAAAHVESNPIAVIPTELWVIAQIASIVLLFTVGLETDLNQFFKFAGPASAVAIGGVILPFTLGAGVTVLLGYADGFGDPVALFMGAIMTATSVGITARVLSDLNRMGSPEGVTIIGAAVVDDVLGILVLAVVVALAETGSVSLGDIGEVAGKAVGFWIVLTGVMILGANLITRVLRWFRGVGTALVLALALALLGGGLAETFGLAMIIGAYSVGLGLSGTSLSRTIEENLMGVYHFMVPIFFVVMGMLVDVGGVGDSLVFGAILTAIAIVSKLVGAGVPALAVGFNGRGAWRVGLGMLPRGEVALIIAGIALSRGVIGQSEFGVAIMMTVVTTLIAPILLVPAFRSGLPGRRVPISNEPAGDAHEPPSSSMSKSTAD
jgi:Kef-type K+ transport system membrane component KefB